jgi:photosystem II stability/assembly factor-like uncharacterized protein
VKRIAVLVVLSSLLLAAGAVAADTASSTRTGKDAGGKAKAGEKEKGGWNADTFKGLKLRNIGPALTAGRIVDVAVPPGQKNTLYVAAAAGGVWKTTNGGTTWTPLFDDQGSYSIGCLALDPHNPLVVWVGAGEANAQRSVSYGDGVYKSVDGGKTWEHMGLRSSEHIGQIVVDPRDSNTVYVAAQGPLWSPGGDRGLYKTTDGGRTWKPILTLSENTGVTEVWLDPRNADVLYAVAYQRRRHVFTVINGGPESAIYKSYDAGATWKKIHAGLPKEDLGRIGLAISPADPNVIYATVEAARRTGGFFRSKDAGANWEKMNDFVPSSGQYYQKLYADPKVVDRVYDIDVNLKVTEDGGRTLRNVGERNKHVDNHVVWIDPDDNNHLLVGCDGGLYESWDRGALWRFFANMPITQFYRVAVDEDRPFYNVYGGTQDNFSLGGPSRTNSVHGISNADWFVTQGGDGFVSVVDPQDPNVVYAESQNGGIVRFDRKSGEGTDIQPQTAKGEAPLRFNWDSPIMISPHSHTRIYFAAQKLFQSDDRGDTWKAVSPDLTRQLDRNKLPVMGRVWSIDAVAKNANTSFYGNIVSLTESPVAAGLLYVGTDDGLVQVTADDGGHWRKVESFPGVPDMTYVSSLKASQHDAGTVYAAFDNHKRGDFKPYLLKSTDRGATWTSIAGDLPAHGTVYAVAEDHVDPNLLFAGTEWGLFFSRDGGRRWVQLKGGMPVIAVRDLAIQKRENDLVVATFGRGFYILDDYSPLRLATPETVQQETAVFPVKPVLQYNQRMPLGIRDKAFQGEALFTAPNPPYGAVFTYYLKDDLRTRRKRRGEQEKRIEEEGGNLSYPTWEELRNEDREREPAILITIADEKGNVIRRGIAPATAGFHRMAWDLRFPPPNPTVLTEREDSIFDDPTRGPAVVPGKYTVTFAKRVEDVVTPLGPPQTFTVTALNTATLPATDRAAVLEFQRKTAQLQRAVLGAVEAAREAQIRINFLQRAWLDTPGADPKLAVEVRALELRLKDITTELSGDTAVSSYNEPTPPSLTSRVGNLISSHWGSSSAPTHTNVESYAVASEQFAAVLEKLHAFEADLKDLEGRFEAAGAPWTPGRVPDWKPQ